MSKKGTPKRKHMPKLPENTYKMLMSLSQSKKMKMPRLIDRLLKLQLRYDILAPAWEEKYTRILEHKCKPESKHVVAFKNYICGKCGGTIKKGEIFQWNINEECRTLYLCLDCEFESGGDKVIAKGLLKKRRVKRDVKVLQRELNRYLDMYEGIDWLKLKDEIEQLTKLLEASLRDYGYIGDAKTAEEILRNQKEILRRSEDFENFYQMQIDKTMKVRKKKKPSYTS